MSTEEDVENSRPILIIDGMNLYMRAWSAYPTMSANGYQMGGCIGFLKTLRKLCNEVSPSAVYVAWEGGGSAKRRAIFKDYKLKRKPERLNRFYGDDIPESENNRQHQLITLLAMLKQMPICQLYASDCEGDDVVAYLTHNRFKNVEKVIASSDKDMYQLLDDKTKIYSFHSKTYVNSNDVFERFRVLPQNFALAKAICGDDGDNVPGIPGIGFKTIVKHIPFLSLEEPILLQDLLNYAHANKDSSKVIKKVSENVEVLKRNWKLVFLDGSMLSQSQIAKIDYAIDTFEPHFNKFEFTKLLIKEGINDFNIDSLFYSFNGLEKYSVK